MKYYTLKFIEIENLKIIHYIIRNYKSPPESFQVGTDIAGISQIGINIQSNRWAANRLSLTLSP